MMVIEQIGVKFGLKSYMYTWFYFGQARSASLHDKKFSYRFIYQHFLNLGTSFLKSENKKAFMSHFVLMMWYSLSKSGAIENRGDAI